MALKITDFTQDIKVAAETAAIDAFIRAKKPRYSNVQSGRFQYVDLVMEGGGVLGLALVGFTYALERANLRFRSTAGTSAGAINALFLQAVAPPSVAKSKKLLNLIAKMPMDKFQDGDDSARKAVDLWLNGGSGVAKAMNFFAIKNELFDELGLNPGDAFRDWVADAMTANKVATMARLRARMNEMPKDLVILDREDPAKKTPVSAAKWSPDLALVTTELATATRMVFPQDAGLCFRHPNKVNPAEFVRASMAVPVFFEPMFVAGHPRGVAAEKRWRKHTGNPRIGVPKKLTFVDGGALSNFPISLFHSDGLPNMPTVGAKLGLESGKTEDVDTLKELLGQTISAMRFDSDRDFIRENPDYRQLVEVIDTRDHHWLNFAMKDNEKIRLFHCGVAAGRNWLERFDWAAYQQTRAELLKARQAARLTA